MSLFSDGHRSNIPFSLVCRQRQITASVTPFSLAQRYLPRELVQDIRMDRVRKPQRMRRPRLDTIQEEEEDGDKDDGVA